MTKEKPGSGRAPEFRHSSLGIRHSFVLRPWSFDIPKITDFGLAKRLHPEPGSNDPDWQTRTGAVLGTAGYMAPEQAEGHAREAGALVDVYALGAILYEALTGRPPFKGETLLDTLDQVRTQEPVSPNRLRPGIPRDLETICLKCLAKEPGRRYAGARALAEDLRRFLAGEPILARPASRTEKLVKWVKRKPALAALVLLAIGLLGGWGWFTYALHRERAIADEQRLRAQEQEEVARNLWATALEQRDRADRLLLYTCSIAEQHAHAMIKAKGEAAVDTTPGGILYALARTFARDAGEQRENVKLPAEDRAQLAERRAASAVKLLQSAGALGYFQNPAKVQRLKEEQELDSLRGRADFNDFVRQLTAQARGSRGAGN